MLLKLSVKNFTLIRDLQIDFSSSLNIITGQTGSGKSLIISAIQLLMGKRNQAPNLNEEKKSIIEGVFKSNPVINKLLKKLDLDEDDELIIRKEIYPNGKSRSFVNDSPVKTDVLKLLSHELIQLNGQHLISDISSNQFKYAFLNSFIEDQQLLNDYNNAYMEFLKFQKHYEDLLKRSYQLNEQRDFYQYQLDELNDADLSSLDEESLNNEYEIITNQEKINNNIQEVTELFSGDNGLIQLLHKANIKLVDFSESFSNISPYSDRLNSIYIELDDLFQEIKLQFPVKAPDLNRQLELEGLLNKLNFLLKKFNVVNVSELIKKRDLLETELGQIDNVEQDLKNYEVQKNHWESICFELAKKINKLRLNNIQMITDDMNKLLAVLSMEHAKFKVEITSKQELNEFGSDQVTLLVAVNNSSNYYPIHQFSSGGELSRIALAMKSLTSIKGIVPILIFDEIDSGVSGKVATEVGKLLKKIAKNVQVINITHLPQVAAMGSTHFHVEKIDQGEGLETKLKSLRKEERIQVLAKMLGGEKTGKAALFNAQELLN